jgi:choline dehydrogenase-like flavoprotein
VLLVETGGDGLPEERRQPYQRYSNAFVLPDLEYGYTTVPQLGLGGRELSYQRGKGLGGSSMINFMVYTRGPAADWDRWADLVGDQEWSWGKAKERFRQVR